MSKVIGLVNVLEVWNGAEKDTKYGELIAGGQRNFLIETHETKRPKEHQENAREKPEENCAI